MRIEEKKREVETSNFNRVMRAMQDIDIAGEISDDIARNEKQK
jgi:hypothetical protein